MYNLHTEACRHSKRRYIKTTCILFAVFDYKAILYRTATRCMLHAWTHILPSATWLTLRETSYGLFMPSMTTMERIRYLTQLGHYRIIINDRLISHLLQVAYTFDAGPNACLYLLEKEVPLVMSAVKLYFPPGDTSNQFIRGPQIDGVNIPQVIITVLASLIVIDVFQY